MNIRKIVTITFALMLVFGFAFVAIPGLSDTAQASGFGDAPTDIDAGGGGTDEPVKNLGSWVAGQLKYLYALLVAIVSIVFIVKHEYSKLVAFFVIAVIVAIPIFAPDAIPTIAKSISDVLTGKGK